jgi:16S rRNA (cytosine967-C5)-methyltransferase
VPRPDKRRRPAPRPAGGGSRYKGAPRPVADPARSVALEVLRGVDERDAYANLLLSQVLERTGLEGRDAAFATELTAGTLRMRGLYDAVLATLVGRPLSELDPAVLDVLRLGCHQLLSMRVPSHAAVSTSVDLVRATIGPRPAGLVNAVLRKVAARDAEAWADQLAPSWEDDPTGREALAIRHSHPAWVVDELRRSLVHAAEALTEREWDSLDPDDEETDPPDEVAARRARAELPALLAADNQVGAVTLVARPGLAEPEELLVEGARRGELTPWAVRLDSGDPGDLAAVREGRAGVQDEGSQRVVQLAVDTTLRGSDSRWLDLCAGPGGKAALLGALAAERGATLVANEVQPHRADLVRQAVARLSNVEVTVQDGRQPTWAPGSFDRVLVDAPCSGLGALRRRPEARWRRRPEDLMDLVRLQQDLLSSALDLVRPGGVVVYATCSPVLAETHDVVESVMGHRRDTVYATLRGVPTDQRSGDFVQLWPHRHDTDAMFAAVLRRSGPSTAAGTA